VSQSEGGEGEARDEERQERGERDEVGRERQGEKTKERVGEEEGRAGGRGRSTKALPSGTKKLRAKNTEEFSGSKKKNKN
jgi:hypothetical protein